MVIYVCQTLTYWILLQCFRFGSLSLAFTGERKKVVHYIFEKSDNITQGYQKFLDPLEGDTIVKGFPPQTIGMCRFDSGAGWVVNFDESATQPAP